MAEAAIFARAYAPSRLSELIPKWSTNLQENQFPFSPDDISATQADHVNQEIEKERQMRA